MLDKKKTIKMTKMIIIIYTTVGVILPFIFKYVIFESTTFSNLSNSEWAGFLGSYVGGILGGLGTLISVFVTVKDSRDMQIENKKDTDKKILDDKAEREKERKEDKILEAQRERRQFADDVAVYVGKYITHISKYFYASRWAEDIDSDFRIAKDKLRKAEQDLIVLNNKISKSGLDDENFIQLELERDQLLDKKKILEREYNEKLNEKEKNSIEGNRTEANGLLSQLDVLQSEMFKYSNFPH